MALLGQSTYTPPSEPVVPPKPAMTVGELIEHLKALPPDTKVEVHEGDGFWGPCTTVNVFPNPHTGETFVQIGQY